MPPKICYEPAMDRVGTDRPAFIGGRREYRDFYEPERASHGRWDDRPRRAYPRGRAWESRDGFRPGAPPTSQASTPPSIDGSQAPLALPQVLPEAVGADQPLSEVGILMDRLMRMLVDIPDAVATCEVSGSHITVIEVKVAKVDHGKVIGRNGRTADALRDILITLGSKHHRRFTLEILE